MFETIGPRPGTIIAPSFFMMIRSRWGHVGKTILKLAGSAYSRQNTQGSGFSSIITPYKGWGFVKILWVDSKELNK